MISDTKECPFCGETIKAVAKKCRYCMEWFPGYTRESVLRDMNLDKGLPADGGVSFEGDANIGGNVAGRDMDVQKGGVRTGDNAEFQAPVAGRDQDIQYGDRYEGEFKIGKELRDEQFEIALNWEAMGKPQMRGFDLSERNLSKLDLAGADLEDAILFEANLIGTDLRGSNLASADLKGAALSGAKLQGADLSFAKLQGAHLEYAELQGAILKYAELQGANLENAELQEANLEHTELQGAVLDHADLSLARLGGANLCGASMYLIEIGENTVFIAEILETHNGRIRTDEELRANLFENTAKYDRDTYCPTVDLGYLGAILVDDEGNPIEDQE